MLLAGCSGINPALQIRNPRKPPMKWTVGAKVGTGFGLASTILLLVGAASYHSASKLAETAHWVAHTQKVLEELEGLLLLAALTHAETGPLATYAAGSDSFFRRCVRSLGRPPWIRHMKGRQGNDPPTIPANGRDSTPLSRCFVKDWLRSRRRSSVPGGGGKKIGADPAAPVVCGQGKKRKLKTSESCSPT